MTELEGSDRSVQSMGELPIPKQQLDQAYDDSRKMEMNTDVRDVPKARRRWFDLGASDPYRFEQEIHDISTCIKHMICCKQDEHVQIELARIANLLPYLKSYGDESRIYNIRIAISGLQHADPNLQFAQAIRHETEVYLLRSQRGMFRLVYVIAGTTPLTALLAGVIASSLCMLVAVLLGFYFSGAILNDVGTTHPFPNAVNARAVVLAAWTIFFAAIGSFTASSYARPICPGNVG
jgi:hypothetical protein